METCICDHHKEDHKGLFKKKQCKLCDCIQYTNVREFRKRKHIDEETIEDLEEELDSLPESIISKLPSMVLMLVLIAMVLGAGAIALSTFQDATSNTAVNVSYNTISELSEQMPMIGTIMGVGMLLTVVMGVFAFFVRGGD